VVCLVAFTVLLPTLNTYFEIPNVELYESMKARLLLAAIIIAVISGPLSFFYYLYGG